MRAAGVVLCASLLGAVASAAPRPEQLAIIQQKIDEGDVLLRQYFAAQRASDQGAAAAAFARVVAARTEALELIRTVYVDAAGKSLLAPTPSSIKVERLVDGKLRVDTVEWNPTYATTPPESLETLRSGETGSTSPSGVVTITEAAFQHGIPRVAATMLREGVRFARIPERSKRILTLSREQKWDVDTAAADERDEEEVAAHQAILDAAAALGLATIDTLLVQLKRNHFAEVRAQRRADAGDEAATAELEQLKEEQKLAYGAIREVARKELEKEGLPERERTRLEEVRRWAYVQSGDAEKARRARLRKQQLALRPGRYVGNFRVGVAPGLRNLVTHGAFELDAEIRVIPNGYVVAGLQFQFETQFAFVMIPVGFQYNIELPWVRGLWFTPRVTLGYAVAAGGGADHFGFVLPEAGGRWFVTNKVHIGLDALSLPIFFNRGEGLLLSYRLAVYAGYNF